MKFIVIGANSFSGSAFCRLLTAHGHPAIELKRPWFDLNAPGAPTAIRHWVGDGYDTVVNFAALNMVGESWQHAADYYQTNVIAMARLADALVTAPLRRFVQVSTPEVYGATKRPVKEWEPFNPSTPYAVSRAACDMHLQALHREYGFPVCFTRTVNVYGPEQQLYRIIPKTVMCALSGKKLPLHGGGKSTRSFIHIDDVARAILRVAERGKPGATYHASTEVQTSIRFLVELVCDGLNVPADLVIEDAPERPGKDAEYWLDDSTIRRELGWSDEIRLQDGLRTTVDWYRENFKRLAGESLEYKHKEVACA